MFVIRAPLPDSITLDFRNGKPCYNMIVRASDPLEPWCGDTATNLAKHTELMDQHFTPIEGGAARRFSILIPECWQVSDMPVLIAQLHRVPGNTVWGLYVRGNEFWFSYNIWRDPYMVDISNKSWPMTPEVWHDFEVYDFLSETRGYGTLTCDGVPIWTDKNFYGANIQPGEKPAYFCLGPYVFQKWPRGVIQRRIYAMPNPLPMEIA